MKLYKNTLIISAIVFVFLIFLSCIFEFTCISDLKVISFLNNYFIGAACSIVVVIITTFIQFKYEQRKALKSVLSDVQFFFFHYLLVIMALDPNEKTTDKQWEYYYGEVYNSVRKISSELSNIEWFSKKARTKRYFFLFCPCSIFYHFNSSKNSPILCIASLICSTE